MGGSQSTLELPTENENVAAVRPPSVSSLLLREDGDEETVDWDLVRQRLQEEPEQACVYAHGMEPSPLFLALTHRSVPVDVVETLMECYEDAMDQQTPNGHTILHVAACCSNDATVVELVLKKRPEFVQMCDSKGRLPLHLCSKNADSAMKLLNAYPRSVRHRSQESGCLPLHYALLQQEEEEEETDARLLTALVQGGKKNHLLHGGILCRNKRGETPLGLLVQRLEKNLKEDLWQVLVAWIRLLHPTCLTLHALLELDCCNTPSLMKRALDDFSEQACQWDDRGRTPLHIVAGTGRCSNEALELLLRANPRAPRMTDNEGRLPIDWAAESPNIELPCLALLMKGEPRAIDTRDLRDGNYPFLAAALGGDKSVNNTYYLLRAKPHVLSYFHTP